MSEVDKIYTTSYTECMKYTRHTDHKSIGWNLVELFSTFYLKFCQLSLIWFRMTPNSWIDLFKPSWYSLIFHFAELKSEIDLLLLELSPRYMYVITTSWILKLQFVFFLLESNLQVGAVLSGETLHNLLFTVIFFQHKLWRFSWTPSVNYLKVISRASKQVEFA